MKKYVKILSALVFAVTLFTGCDNFLSGSGLKEELNETISYLNYPFVNISVNSDNQATKIIKPANGSYPGKYKKTDSLSLNFEENPEYQFTKWIIVPENGLKFVSESGQTENLDQLKTIKAIITTDGKELSIYPETFIRPTASFSPTNIVAVAKNTSIFIDFSHKIEFSEEEIENNLSDFKITMEGVDLRINNYYLDPVISETEEGNTQILFQVNREKLIQLPAAEANITVTVPSGIYYLSEDGFKIYSAKEINYTFLINNQTLDYIDVNVISSTNHGSISYSGSKRYYLDDEINLSFEPDPGYRITDWKIVKNYNTENEIEIPKTTILKKVSEDKKSVTATIMTGSQDEVTIVPVIETSQYLEASFNGKHGNITPSETKRLYAEDTLSLSFKEDTNYYFTNWKVYDKLTGRYLAQNEIYTIFEKDSFDLSKDTQELKVKELTKDYKLEFNVDTLERPQILSVTPTNSPDGTYRDSTIQVMFDHAVEEDSVYFTSDEIIDLKKQYNITDADIKSTLINGEEKYYSYVYNNQIYYKNITIQNYRTGANILENFGAPYFDTATILLIPTNDDKLPAPGTVIFVTISSDFYYKDTTKPAVSAGNVTMREPKKWNYLTNAKVDSAPPTFNTEQFVFKRKLNDGTFVDFLSNADDGITFTTQQDLIDNFTLLNELKLSISISDGYGSGPAAITYKIHNLDTDTYSEEIPLDLTFIGTDAGFGNYDGNGDLQPVTIDLSNVTDISLGGINTIQFTGIDKKNNGDSTDYFYFYIDNVAPKFIENPTIATQGANILVNWTNPTELDFDKVRIEYKEKGSSSSAIVVNDIDRGATSKVLELENGKTYDIKVYPVDILGNKDNVDSIYINTTPNKVANFITSVSTDSPNSITVRFNKPEGHYNGAIVYWSNTAGFTPDPLDETHKATIPATDSESYSFTLSSLAYGSKTYFKVCSYDDYNISDYSADNGVIILPLPVNDLSAVRKENASTNTINLSWTNPASNYDSIKIYKKISNETEYTLEAEVTDGSTTYSATELIGGTLYDFKVLTYLEIEGTGLNSNKAEVSCNTLINNSITFNAEQDVNNLTEKIKLTWTNPAGNFTGVRIFRKINSEDDSSFTLIKDITDHSEEYYADNLSGGTKYTFKFVPYVTIINMDYEANALTATANTNPKPVSGISLERDEVNPSNTVLLSWTNPEDVFTGINISYRNITLDNDASYIPLDVITNGSTTKTITDLDSGSKYEFKVVSCVTYGENYYSVPVTDTVYTLSDSISGLSSENNTSSPTNSIILNWFNSTGNFSGIKIYKKLYGLPYFESEPIAVIDNTTTTSKLIEGLEPGTKYTFKVSSYATIGGIIIEDTKGCTTSNYTKPDKVTSVAYSNNTANSVKLAWANPVNGDYDGLKVFYKENTASVWTQVTASSSTVKLESDVLKDSVSCKVTGLTAGTKYDFKINPYVKFNSIDYLSEADTISTGTKPQPVSLRTPARNNDDPTSRIDLSWENNGAYDGIKVYYSNDNNSWNLITTSSTTVQLLSEVVKGSTSCTVTGLTSNKLYYFKVVEYSTSNDIDRESVFVSTSFATSPVPITGLTLSRNSDNPTGSINISWTSPDSGSVTGYRIYKGTSSGSLTEVSSTDLTELSASSTSCVVSGLSTSNIYYFSVRPYYNDASSFAADPSTIPSLATAPNPVTNLTASRDSSNPTTTIKLNWTKPSSSVVTGYNVYKKLDTESSYTLITSTLSGSATTYTVTGLTASNKYSFKVIPYYDTTSSYSIDPVTIPTFATSPVPITGLTLSRNELGAGSSIILSWTSPAAGTVSGYRIYKGTSLDNLTEVSSNDLSRLSASSTTCDVYRLSASTKYYFTVRPYYNDASSFAADSSTIPSFATAPVPVTNLTASRNSDNPASSINISWDSPASGTVSGFKIFIGTDADNLTEVNDSNLTALSASSTSCTVSGLSASTIYYYSVRPYYNHPDSYAQETYLHNYTTAPDPVTVFTASRNSSYPATSIDLSWEKPANCNVTGYYLYEKGSTNTSYSSVVTLPADSTSYTVSGLLSSLKYDFLILPYYNSVSSKADPSSTVSFATAPRSVTNLTASRNSSNPATSINLSWEKPLNSTVTGYIVYKKGPSDSSYTQVTSTLSGSATSYVVSGLSVSTNYVFKVIPYYLTTSYYAYDPLIAIDITAPNPVTSLSASRNNANPTKEIDLSWVNPSNTYSRIGLFYKLNDSDTWNEVTTEGTVQHSIIQTSSNRSYCTVAGLTSKKLYDFEVRVYSKYGTFENYNSTKITFATSPNKVTTLTSSRNTNNIQLNWSAPTGGGQSGYKIYYKKESTDGWTEIKTTTTPHLNTSVSSSSTVCKIEGLEYGKKYYFNVVPYFSLSGNIYPSDYSNTTYCYTYPDVASDLTAVANSINPCNIVTLKWKKPDTNFTGFKVYRQNSNSTWEEVTKLGSISITTITGPNNNGYYQCNVLDLTDYTKYKFKICTYVTDTVSNSDIINTEGVEKEVCTAPKPVTDLHVEPVTGHEDGSFIVYFNNPYSSNGPKSYIEFKAQSESEYRTIELGAGVSSRIVHDYTLQSSQDEILEYERLTPATKYEIIVYTKYGDLKSKKTTTYYVTRPLNPCSTDCFESDYSPTSTTIYPYIKQKFSSYNIDGIKFYIKKETATSYPSTPVLTKTKAQLGDSFLAFQISGLEEGTSYKLKAVTYKTVDGTDYESAPSEYLYRTRGNLKVNNFTVTKKSDGTGVVLKWDRVPNLGTNSNFSYTIKVNGNWCNEYYDCYYSENQMTISEELSKSNLRYYCNFTSGEQITFTIYCENSYDSIYASDDEKVTKTLTW